MGSRRSGLRPSAPLHRFALRALRARRRLFELFAALPLGLALWAPGCALQGEGERCDSVRAGDDDCEAGLVCVRKEELVDGSVDRCCPPQGETSSDDRCIRSTGAGGSGGSGGSGGTGGTSGDSGGGEAGAAGSDGSAGAAGSGGTAGDASAEAEASDDGAADGAGGDASGDVSSD